MNIPSGGGVCVAQLVHFMVYFTTDMAHLVGGSANMYTTHHQVQLCPGYVHLEQVTVTDSAYHHTTHEHLDRQFRFYSCTSLKVNHPNLGHVLFGSLECKTSSWTSE